MAGNKLMSGSTGGVRCYVRPPLMELCEFVISYLVFVFVFLFSPLVCDEYNEINVLFF